MNWYIKALKQYAVFEGRAQRAEYWYYILFYILISITLGIIDTATGSFNAQYGFGIFSTLYSVLLLIPTVAVTVRRLHDTDRTGWWQLIFLIPIIGWIVMIVFLAQDSQPGTNQYGANPKC